MQQSALNFIYFLAAIGAIYFILFLIKVLWALLKLMIPSRNLCQSYGKNCWAVVTGGSDGIGLGFCQELAKGGINVCIVARNQAKCRDVEANLKEINSEISTKTVIADFVECQTEGFFDKIIHQIGDIDVGILVNNVGISNMGDFHELPAQRILNQMNVNVVVMTMMSHYLVPRLLKRQPRSAIINISSFAGLNPVPYVSTYSATKAYNDFLSKAIGMEYDDKIDVLSVQPMLVESNMSKAKKGCTTATRNQCAAASIKSLGIEYETNGWWRHRFMAYMISKLPTFLVRYLSKAESKKLMEREKQKVLS